MDKACNFHLSFPILLAYSGESCEQDRDGCAEIQCFEKVACQDVLAPGFGATCGPCPAGYTGDGEKCSGIWLYSRIL